MKEASHFPLTYRGTQSLFPTGTTSATYVRVCAKLPSGPSWLGGMLLIRLVLTQDPSASPLHILSPGPPSPGWQHRRERSAPFQIGEMWPGRVLALHIQHEVSHRLSRLPVTLSAKQI